MANASVCPRPHERRSGGASTDAIHRWLTSDISADAESERLSQRGRHQSFSEDFQKLCVGFGVHRRLSLLTLEAKDVIDFGRGFFNVELTPSYISRLLTGHGMSSQLAMARNSRMVSPKVADDCVDFILLLRRLKREFPGLLGMDETGLWSNTVARRTYHFRSQYATPPLPNPRLPHIFDGWQIEPCPPPLPRRKHLLDFFSLLFHIHTLLARIL